MGQLRGPGQSDLIGIRLSRAGDLIRQSSRCWRDSGRARCWLDSAELALLTRFGRARAADAIRQSSDPARRRRLARAGIAGIRGTNLIRQSSRRCVNGLRHPRPAGRGRHEHDWAYL